MSALQKKGPGWDRGQQLFAQEIYTKHSKSAAVSQACNPSYLDVEIWKITSWRAAQVKSP
jgi:hypothetical protein